MDAREICRKVSEHLEERANNLDRWACFDEVWRRGYGDCNDFAVCIEQLCHENGVKCKIYLTYPPVGEGHAFAVGDNWMSDMGDYIEISSFSDVKKRAADILSCDPLKIWYLPLTHQDVQRFCKTPNLGRSSDPLS